ncbi:MAG: pyridoxal phosphate-dependent decarboxylase family protein [Candidatus Dormibacteria bacterium]
MTLDAEEFLQDIDPAEFRELGQLAVEQLAHYLEGVEELPVLSRSRPGELLAQLPQEAPEEGEDLRDILADLDRLLLPGLTHWAHPRFFAYFTSSGSAAGIMAELLTAGLNVNAMLWRTSPAATELEWRTCRWLGRMIGLPDRFAGHIEDTASVSTLLALAAAREQLDLDVRERGLSGRPDLPGLRVYSSDQAHSSVEKALLTLGLGRVGHRQIPSDAAFRLQPRALEEAVAADLRSGLRPMAVVATVGTTATTSVDPLPAIAEIARRHRIWLHVDAAHGGAMAVVPEWRWVLEGAEHCDSLVINPHKWLFTPLDCSVLFTAHPEMLRQAFSLVPEYLRDPSSEEGGAEGRDLMDYGISLGRRMRALKLWFVLRHYGRLGLQRRIRQHVRLAHWLRGRIEETPGWELAAPVTMSTLCFRHRVLQSQRAEDEDGHNRAILERVNGSGRVFISHAVLRERFVLRASIGSIRTTPEDVAVLWQELEAAARA